MITRKNISFFLVGLALSTTGAFSVDLPNFTLKEIPDYTFIPAKGKELLIMDYASPIIKNPDQWQNHEQHKKIVKVDIIFTKYPFHKKDWITHYDTLLKNRIESISKLEPGVLDKGVRWNLIMQTSCTNEAEAEKLFHGVVFWFSEETVAARTETQLSQNRSHETKVSSNIDNLMSGRYIFPDSVVYKVLERNTHWQNMLIVNDWTSSMYQFGAQAVLWHKSTLEQERVSRFVFFNDGDNKVHKKTGKTGGIYFSDPDNIHHIIHTMKKVQRNGDGGDTPENDIEALLKATDKTKSFNEVILIADNRSPVKDIELLSKLNIPVRIIVCGLGRGSAIRHDYLQIASFTKGSVHTIEEDIWNLSEIKEGERITIMDIEYQRAKGRIVKSKLKYLKAHL